MPVILLTRLVVHYCQKKYKILWEINIKFSNILGLIYFFKQPKKTLKLVSQTFFE
ncbi:hypothetical protein H1P_1450014 [Hyella patelloides LEGE 07179]|uniref:Uncharacterized protein n=1 Tax=Hyella patelloides LEGE 07179 TaxID=945734 RepID=A0A563VLR6_9CYAN|nr:hypothetical protein H1P_1450014 [Hyella patelloides LEGE 07179]